MNALRRGLPALRGPARLRLIAIAAALGALVGLGAGLADEPTYEATATVVAIDRGPAAEEVGSGAATTPAGFDERAVELARSSETADLAAASLGGDLAGADLLAETRFMLSAGADVLEVSSRAGFADLAAAASNAYAGAFVELNTLFERRRLNRLIDRLEEDLADAEPESGRADALTSRLAAAEELLAAGPPVRAGAEAGLPEQPVEEGAPALGALLGAALGALLAVIAIVAREAARRPLRDGS